MLVYADGDSVSTIGGGGLERLVSKEALRVLEEGQPRILTFSLGLKPKEDSIEIDSKCGGEVKIFMDPIKPEPRLIIIGSGHIGKPLAEFSLKVGFDVVVVDDAVTTTKERFPEMELHPGLFEDELENVDKKPIDFVAIVHGETKYELVALRSLLKRKPNYIGLLGSKTKAKEHKTQLLKEGYDEASVDRIHAPIGMDIGAVTPEEIAISILAELIKVRRG